MRLQTGQKEYDTIESSYNENVKKNQVPSASYFLIINLHKMKISTTKHYNNQ